jgi:hypothetical protein
MVVWGATEEDNIVWGTTQAHTIVWGTSETEDNIVWGTAQTVGYTTVWGACRIRGC